jgi:hypothetical protein
MVKEQAPLNKGDTTHDVGNIGFTPEEPDHLVVF